MTFLAILQGWQQSLLLVQITRRWKNKCVNTYRLFQVDEISGSGSYIWSSFISTDGGSWLVCCCVSGPWNDHGCLLHSSVHHLSSFAINTIQGVKYISSQWLWRYRAIFMYFFAAGKDVTLLLQEVSAKRGQYSVHMFCCKEWDHCVCVLVN